MLWLRDAARLMQLQQALEYEHEILWNNLILSLSEVLPLSPPASCSAPDTLATNHSWTTDLCHLAPSSCNADGHLTRLALPGLGITCPEFPTQLGKLKHLTRLDLSGNDLEAATMQDVEEVHSCLV